MQQGLIIQVLLTVLSNDLEIPSLKHYVVFEMTEDSHRDMVLDIQNILKKDPIKKIIVISEVDIDISCMHGEKRIFFFLNKHSRVGSKSGMYL